MDSLLNEMKLDFKRGQRIKFTDHRGDVRVGKYVMASSAEGYIVLDMGGNYGTPKVIPIDKIIPNVDYGILSVNALKRIK